MTRPSWIMSKAERKAAELYDMRIMEAFADKQAGLYKWEIPDEFRGKVPDGYIEECMFWTGAVAPKLTGSLGWILLPAAPSTYDIYGHPVEWLPAPLGATNIPTDVMGVSDTAVLYDAATCDKIEPLVKQMTMTAHALTQNINVLGQPVMIETTADGKLNGEILADYIKSGDLTIPRIGKGVTEATVLDLKAQDHTQNLLATYHDLEDQCLMRMGITNNGVGKASGVTTAETLAGAMQVNVILQHGLDIRQKWCDDMRRTLGLKFSVALGEGVHLTEVEMEGMEDNADNYEEEEE